MGLEAEALLFCHRPGLFMGRMKNLGLVLQI